MAFWHKKQITRRTIFVGDVHGCLAELQRLIRKLRLGAEDRVIMLGDLINRGPDSAGCVEFVARRGFECLMGNHDLEYLQRYLSSERYGRLRDQLGPQLHQWLEQRPFFLESAEFLAVHAGLWPRRRPERTPPRVLVNIRTWDGRGRDLSNPANPPWYEFYSGEKPVFYGHWARKGLNIRERSLGLDSGCVYGRALSACVLESREIIQMPATRVYYTPPSLRGPGGTVS
ncbi:MAG: metallophosphoesterase [Leptospirales bacterium]|nr:metallophosphoesterase [Leptospirales bacterium]